jgi:hypothetical protein
MREDFENARSPTPSRELQQHKWSCSGSSLSGRVIASVAAGRMPDIRNSPECLRYIREPVDLAETLRALTSTEFCHEADTHDRQCQCSLLARPHDPAVGPEGSSANKKDLRSCARRHVRTAERETRLFPTKVLSIARLEKLAKAVQVRRLLK